MVGYLKHFHNINEISYKTLRFLLTARGEYRFLYASTLSVVRGKHGVVYMGVVSTIIFKGLNSIILICSIMKELTFPRFIS